MRDTVVPHGKTLDEEREAAAQMSLKLKAAFDPDHHQEDALDRAAKTYAQAKVSEAEAEGEAGADADKVDDEGDVDVE